MAAAGEKAITPTCREIHIKEERFSLGLEKTPMEKREWGERIL